MIFVLIFKQIFPTQPGSNIVNTNMFSEVSLDLAYETIPLCRGEGGGGIMEKEEEPRWKLRGVLALEVRK